MNKPHRYNRLVTGVILGMLVPLAGLLVYYFVRKTDLPFSEFIRVYFNLGMLTHIISLSVLPNLLLFFAFIRSNWLYAARGVLLSTILFAISVAVIRFI